MSKRCLCWAWPGDRAGSPWRILSCETRADTALPELPRSPPALGADLQEPGGTGVARHRWGRPLSPEGSAAGQSLPDLSGCPSAARSHPQDSPLVTGAPGRTPPPRRPQRAPGPRPFLGARSRGRETVPAFPRPGPERGFRRCPGLLLAGALRALVRPAGRQRTPRGPGRCGRSRPASRGQAAAALRSGGSFRAGGVRKGASLRHPALRNSAQAPLCLAGSPQELKTPLFLCKQLGQNCFFPNRSCFLRDKKHEGRL